MLKKTLILGFSFAPGLSRNMPKLEQGLEPIKSQALENNPG
jgi:hypothetical protein